MLKSIHLRWDHIPKVGIGEEVVRFPALDHRACGSPGLKIERTNRLKRRLGILKSCSPASSKAINQGSERGERRSSGLACLSLLDRPHTESGRARGKRCILPSNPTRRRKDVGN